MSIVSPPPASLKVRMASVVFLLVLAAVLLVSVTILMLAERDMRSVIGRQQVTALSSTAAFIDEEIKSRQQMLRALADSMTAANMTGLVATRRFMQAQQALKEEFFNVIVVGTGGAVFAGMHSSGKVADGLAINLKDRPYFAATLATRAPVISRPMNSVISGLPVVLLTQPVFDAGGAVTAVLIGSVDLRQSDFLGKLRQMTPGKTGYLFIMTADGLILEHPDRKRLMRHIDAFGPVSAASHAALTGFEGWAAGITQSGVPSLIAYKRVPSSGWIVGSVYPDAEAFLPLHDMRGNGVLAAIVLATLASLGGWRIIWRLLKPLEVLRQHIFQIRQQRAGIDVLQVARKDEIGDLSRAFHALMSERERAELQARDGDALLRSILEQAPDAVIGIAAGGQVAEWNREAADKFGWPREQALGMRIDDLIGPGVAQDGEERAMTSWLAQGGGASARQIRASARHRDGRLIPVEISLAQVMHDGAAFSTAFLRDISDRLAGERRLAASEQRARIIADAMPALIAYIDKDLRYQFLNVHYRKLFGIDPKSMVGKNVRDVIDAATYADMAPQLDAALRGERVHFERPNMRIGGIGGVDQSGHKASQEAYFMFDYIPELAPDGAVAGFYVLATDISERRNAELRQAASEKRLQLIADHMPVVIVYIDRQHRLQFSNATFEKWFGIAPRDAVSRKLADVYGEANYQLRKPYLERAFGGVQVEYEFSNERDGVACDYQAIYVPDIGADGVVAGVYGLIHEITRSKAVETALKFAAATDTLTGIANRRSFDEKFELSLRRAVNGRHPLALAYLDIDRFKAINDTLGHSAGDDVLKEFAARLVAGVRASDLVARLAGDEFVIIFEHMRSAQELSAIARKIIDSVRQPFVLACGAVPVTTSIGIVLLDPASAAPVSTQQLLDSADRALYDAKNAGRDGYAIIEMG